MRQLAPLLALRRAAPIVLAATLSVLQPTPAYAASVPDNLLVQTEKAAKDFLKDQAERQSLTGIEVTVSALPPNPAPPACPQRFEIVPVDTRFLPRMRFSARCPSSGATIELIVRGDVAANVVVAATDIQAGKPIPADALALEKRSIASTPDAFGNEDDLANLTSRRSIRAGQVLQKRHMQAAQLVRRNQSVKIVARNQQIEVTVPGLALENGGQDDLIKVKNVATGRTISARVTGPGTVAPEGDAPTGNRQSGD